MQRACRTQFMPCVVLHGESADDKYNSILSALELVVRKRLSLCYHNPRFSHFVTHYTDGMSFDLCLCLLSTLVKPNKKYNNVHRARVEHLFAHVCNGESSAMHGWFCHMVA